MNAMTFAKMLSVTTVMTLLAGCSAEGGESDGELDSAEASEEGFESGIGEEVNEESAAIKHVNLCPKEAEFSDVSTYVFDGGHYIVCWYRERGPAGSRDNYYRLLNQIGRTQRLRIALNNTDDTNCVTLGNHQWASFRELSLVFGAGRPQRVKTC